MPLREADAQIADASMEREFSARRLSIVSSDQVEMKKMDLPSI